LSVQEEFGLEDVTYKNKTLAEWQDRFTIIIPELPSTNNEVQKFLAKINNAYHAAYNQYNDLMVTCSKNEKDVNAMQLANVSAIYAEYREQGIAKFPAKEMMLELALVRDDTIKNLNSEKLLYELIKEFFDNHRIKLEKTMHIAGNLTYLVNGADRTHWKSGDPTI
jgi:hypothetical protein